MKLFNGVSALVAVLAVVGYLITRPHVGTVWYMTNDAVAAGQSLMLRSDFVPDSPGPWFHPTRPAPFKLPSTRFTDKHDCWAARDRYESATSAKFLAHVDGGLYCATEYALLWGW
jgi:hypothetical protein